MKNIITIAILSAAITLSAQANSTNFDNRDLQDDIKACLLTQKLVKEINMARNIVGEELFIKDATDPNDAISQEQQEDQCSDLEQQIKDLEDKIREASVEIRKKLDRPIFSLHVQTAEACYHAAVKTTDPIKKQTYTSNALFGYLQKGDIDTLVEICKSLWRSKENPVDCDGNFKKGMEKNIKEMKTRSIISE